MRTVALPNWCCSSSSSCASSSSYCNIMRVTAMAKSKKSNPSNKDPESAPPRITSNVKQNLQFLRLWKEFQKRKSNTPKPATSYRRKKVQKEELPEDTEIYRDPTTSLY